MARAHQLRMRRGEARAEAGVGEVAGRRGGREVRRHGRRSYRIARWHSHRCDPWYWPLHSGALRRCLSSPGVCVAVLISPQSIRPYTFITGIANCCLNNMQMMQNVGGGGAGGGSGSFSAGDRHSLVQPPPSGGSPLPMHRNPLPATTGGRISPGAGGSAGGVGSGGLSSPGSASPQKRGVAFSLSHSATNPAAVAAAAANAVSLAAAQAAAGAGGHGGGYAESMDSPELSVGRFEAL